MIISTNHILMKFLTLLFVLLCFQGSFSQNYCKSFPNGHKLEWTLGNLQINVNFTLSKTLKTSSSVGYVAVGFNRFNYTMPSASIIMGYNKSIVNEYEGTTFGKPIGVSPKISNTNVMDTPDGYRLQFTRPLTAFNYFPSITNVTMYFLISYQETSTPLNSFTFVKHSKAEFHPINFFTPSECSTIGSPNSGSRSTFSFLFLVLFYFL
jgi:hypothetical protein